MIIRKMNREECVRVLAGAKLARLGCSNGNQPYIVPVYLAYHEASGCLYGFTTPGQKIALMRANPLVCVEVDEVAACDQWVSVIAIGRYEELPETPGTDGAQPRAVEQAQQVAETTPPWSAVGNMCAGTARNEERRLAWEVLKALPWWWRPGSAASAAREHRDPAEPFVAVYYKIRIDRITGHEATRDARDAGSYAVPAPPNGSWGWLRRTITRVFGGTSKAADSASGAASPAAEKTETRSPQAVDRKEEGKFDAESKHVGHAHE